MKDKIKKPSNLDAAIMIAEKYGTEIPDEKLIEVAKEFGYKPNNLIENYKFAASLVQIFNK